MKALEQLILSKSRPVQKEAKRFGVSELDKLIMEALLGEAGKEDQEHNVIKTINTAVKNNQNKPILLKIGQWERNDIVGAGKVIGNAKYGKEPYTDIVFHIGRQPPKELNVSGKDSALLQSDKFINISAKQSGGAPSIINMSREALAYNFPAWLKLITQAAVVKLGQRNIPEGHWSAALKSVKTINSLIRKLSVLVPSGAEVLLRVGDKDYPLTSIGAAKKYVAAKKGKDKEEAQRSKDVFVGALNNDITNGLPPRIGGFGADPVKMDGKYYFISKNEDVIVPDVFSKVPVDEIEKLFIGTPDLGGPIEYVYFGPRQPAILEDEPGVYTLQGQMKDAEYYVKRQAVVVDTGQTTSKRIYLRMRRRSFDTPFGGVDQAADKRLGFPVYGPAALVRGSKKVLARLVTADKKDPLVGPTDISQPDDGPLFFDMPPIPTKELDEND